MLNRPGVRIAAYNIMSGGFAQYSERGSEPERIDELKLAIGALNADVVGLVDTFRWDSLFTERDLCEMFGYRYAACINLNDDRLRRIGHNNGLTILSNYPLGRIWSVRIATRDALYTEISIGGGRLNLLLAYLDDLSEDVRLEQAWAIIEQFSSIKPMVIMGDFNTFKLSDDIFNCNEYNDFVINNALLAQKLEPQLRDAARGEVMAAFESAGLVDAGEARMKTFPSRLFPAQVGAPIFRIDYVLHSPGIVIGDMRVPSDEVYQEASDHLPVVAEVSL